MKGIQIGKEEMKLYSQTCSLCRQSNGIHEKATRTNQWVSKITGYKINKQNQFYFYVLEIKKSF